MLVICMTIAFCHLSLTLHQVEPAAFYSFAARQPFIYRVLIPAAFSLLPVNFATCSTSLKFPIGQCADVAALSLDWLALVLACTTLLAAFRLVAAHARTPLRQPGLIVPIFLWMVIFDYILVPNRSVYYPYDFLQLLFFSGGVWLGTSGRGGYWGLPLLTFVSALNKEDAVFVPVISAIYAYWGGRLDRRVILTVVASILLVVIAKYLSVIYIKDFIRVPTVDHPVLFENQLLDNLRQTANPIAWLSWLSAFGGGLFLMALPITGYRRLKLVVVGLCLSWLAIIFVFGVARQLRLMGPLILPVVLPTMLIVDSLLYRDQNRGSRIKA
jgi:hypothetical protein